MLKPSRRLPILNPSERNVRCFKRGHHWTRERLDSLDQVFICSQREWTPQQWTPSGRREEAAENEMKMESEEEEFPPAFHFSKHHPNLPRRKSTRLDWPPNPRKNIFKTEK
jgi:hypothetical protein